MTDDYGETSFTFLSSIDNYGIIGTDDPATNDGWAMHLVEAQFDFELAELSIYLDGAEVRWSNTAIPWASDEDYMDFTEVRVSQWNIADEVILGGQINVDNIYAGDVPIPEPATLLLFGLGALTLGRRKKITTV